MSAWALVLHYGNRQAVEVVGPFANRELAQLGTLALDDVAYELAYAVELHVPGPFVFPAEEPEDFPEVYVCEYGPCPARADSGVCCGASPW